MKTLTDHLAMYASYHRDRRNIATHFIGIPLIVVAVAILLARPAIPLSFFTFSPALVVVVIATLFYLKLDRALGIVMGLVLAATLAIAQVAAQQSTSIWLGSGIGLFVIGWIIQFIGHYYEGKKPAFVDDLIGLAIGPLFVAAELAFKLGMRLELRADIERIAGPERN